MNLNKQLRAIELIEANPSLQSLFFEKTTSLEWFELLKQHNYFNPENNPKPEPIVRGDKNLIRMPNWKALNYLVESSKYFSTPNLDKKYSNYPLEYLNIIREATQYAKQNNYSNWHTWYNFSKILLNIPANLLNENDIDLINYWLQEGGFLSALSNLDKLINNLTQIKQFDLITNLLDKIFTPIFDEENEKYYFTHDNYYLNEFIQEITKNLDNQIKFEVINILVKHLEQVIFEKEDNLNCVLQPAIEPHKQNEHHHEVSNFLIQAIVNILHSFSIDFIQQNLDDIKKLFESLKNHELKTLQRIAIYMLNIFFSDLKSNVDYFIDEKYFIDIYQHELWTLIKKHYSSFSTNQKTKLENIIQNLESQKEKWSKVLDNNYQDDKASFAYYTQIRSGYGDSPITKQQMHLMDIADLINTLNNDCSEKEDYFRNNALREEFGKYFLEKSEMENLSQYFDKFLDLKPEFIEQIFNSYTQLINNQYKKFKNIIPKLQEFIANVLNKYFENSRIADYITSLIKSFYYNQNQRDRKNEYDFSVYEKSINIIKTILKYNPSQEFTNQTDAMSRSINNVRGKTIELLIIMLIQADNFKNDLWNKHIKFIFNDFISKIKNNNLEYEFITLLNNYIAYVYSIDKTWIQENINIILPNKEANYQNWLCAVQGLSYSGNFILEIYSYLEKNNYFFDILQDENLEKNIKPRCLSLLLIAYFGGEINIENNIDNQLTKILNLDEKYLLLLVEAVWNVHINSINKSNLYILWEKLLEILKPKPISKEIIEIYEKMGIWIKYYIDELNPQTKNLINQIIIYADDYNLMSFMKKFVNINADYIIEKWLEYLENKNNIHDKEKYLWHYDNDIEIIFKSLHQQGKIQECDKVCSIYSKKYSNNRPLEILIQYTKIN